ncbi:DNA methyltransferase [Kyrpidia spormannii]|uniref:DNA modification methylase n=2 Tax=Kyrpidia spormannii TaxID=2055160 RepID=A0ACA8Z5E5_9BACL|nr:DNA methyltransferase [Kyrpidia spormannii]CAB3389769.1 DNA modification methylase [Kyrpidia spormannii]CAB3390665.1 DNA modification methylase [Kyrpidia spormannii]
MNGEADGTVLDNTTEGLAHTALNGIAPYFTMFPLSFPYAILKERAREGEWVLDPFCGRGTTNYAARLLGLPSVGIDSSPVAVALSEAKLVNTTPERVIRAAEEILEEVPVPAEVPEGEFWEWAFDTEVLEVVCRLREGLLANCRSHARKALRALLLGALHGPRGKTKRTYFSNQCQRTYAPKPNYAVTFWKRRDLRPEPVDVLGIIRERADRYFGGERTRGRGKILRGDSREEAVYRRFPAGASGAIRWVVTSPPYYGMNTYLPDQWLRLWFLGGAPEVAYGAEGQIRHSSPGEFAAQIRRVWMRVGQVCAPGAQLVFRFGGIRSRKADPLEIVRLSLEGTGWRLTELRPAGTADAGRRQALHIARTDRAKEETDVFARWEG